MNDDTRYVAHCIEPLVRLPSYDGPVASGVRVMDADGRLTKYVRLRDWVARRGSKTVFTHRNYPQR